MMSRMAEMNFDSVKVVATDIDGTIMPEAGLELDASYVEIIPELRAAGYRVIIASGRQMESIERLFEPVLDEIDIVANGGLCLKGAQGWEMLESVPRAWVEEMERDMEQLPDVEGLFCGLGMSYAQHPQSEMCCFLRDAYRINLYPLEGVGCLPDVPLGKISLYSRDGVEARSRSFIEKWSSRLSLTVAGEYWIDCTMQGINKAQAIQGLLTQYGLRPEQLMASGDQMNDYEMLRMAGLSLAVSNADARLRAVATHCPENADFLAVARAWRSLLESR